jgi:hypothetical protein
MNTIRNGSLVTGVRNQLAKILALMLALALIIPGALAMYPAVNADAKTGKAASTAPPLIDRLRQAAAAKAAPAVVRVSHTGTSSPITTWWPRRPSLR